MFRGFCLAALRGRGRLAFPIATHLRTYEEAVFISKDISATAVSARVDGLIARHHGGDNALAARRLGIDPKLLAGILSGDWRQFSLDALIAIIRVHGVTIDWLLGSDPGSWQQLDLGMNPLNMPSHYIDHASETTRRMQ
jgi:hypothetical protein